MFCAYCKKSIPADAVFCPECGRQLGTDAHARLLRKEQNRTGALSLMMMVLMLSWRSVASLLNLLKYNRLYHWPTQLKIILPAAILLAVLGLLILLIARGLIQPRVYGLPDLLTILVWWQVLPELLDPVLDRILSSYANWAGDGFRVMHNIAFPALQFEDVWLLLGLILLGLERQKKGRPAKKHWLLMAVFLTVFLALRSVLSFVFAEPLVKSAILTTSTVQTGTTAIQIWSMFSWLLPASILLVFHCLGSGKIGWIGAMLALCATQVGEVLLVPVVLSGLHMDATGYGLVFGLAPLCSFVVLAIAMLMKKIQKRTEPTPQI